MSKPGGLFGRLDRCLSGKKIDIVELGQVLAQYATIEDRVIGGALASSPASRWTYWEEKLSALVACLDGESKKQAERLLNAMGQMD